MGDVAPYYNGDARTQDLYDASEDLYRWDQQVFLDYSRDPCSNPENSRLDVIVWRVFTLLFTSETYNSKGRRVFYGPSAQDRFARTVGVGWVPGDIGKGYFSAESKVYCFLPGTYSLWISNWRIHQKQCLGSMLLSG